MKTKSGFSRIWNFMYG